MGHYKNCISCKHWKPYWDGNEWGVRAFSEAPESVRQEIITKLETFRKTESYDQYNEKYYLEDNGDEYNISYIKNGLSESLPADWYDWGECTISEYDRDNLSLKRRHIAIDGSEYFAILRCAANFGCVSHEDVEI